MREPCTNMSDSAIASHYTRYSESVKRKGRLDSLNFILEFPDQEILPRVRAWATERGIRSWGAHSTRSVLDPEASSAQLVVLKVRMSEDDPKVFKAIFTDIQAFRHTFGLEHCGIYSQHSLSDLSKGRGEKK